MSWLSPDDLARWNEGRHYDSYRRLGAHPVEGGGTQFTVWAPYAERVDVIGDFNGWQPGPHQLERQGAGLWSLKVSEAAPGHHYKYRIKRGYYQADKTDPYAFAMEAPVSDGNPIAGLSAIVSDLSYEWGDGDWMQSRPDAATAMKRPMSVYEVHLGSWKRKPDGSVHTYREIAHDLADHAAGLGFTHVELMPVLEHPYYGSWGYQVVGYFAPTHRYGTPQDLMYLIDVLHQRGLGVLLDWVPAHFATDPQGLVFFDGSTLFEADDPRMRTHPDWGTYVFDYAKPGVRSFLVSNALFWLDRYHIDGLRFDAVASMLYRDYSRQEWTPNQYGGRENLEAIHLLKEVNEQVYSRFPSAMTIAEESTAWPGVSAPTYNGGLGFGYKWNMGWMHDTLEYFSKDPAYRAYHHNNVTFPLMYAFSEHFVLPL
jgi:1,4-alpha-glucan branching enzyme